MTGKKQFTITKKIAKHGNQAIIVIPKILEDNLRPGTVAEVQISVLEEAGRRHLENNQTLYEVTIRRVV